MSDNIAFDLITARDEGVQEMPEWLKDDYRAIDPDPQVVLVQVIKDALTGFRDAGATLDDYSIHRMALILTLGLGDLGYAPQS